MKQPVAKKTKAQREAREDEELRLQREEEVRTYPDRLMSVLQRACAVNFELTVKNGRFLVYDRDEGLCEVFWLTVDHSAHSENVLEALEFEVTFKTKEQAEIKYKLELKRSAMEKLSQEERDVLGL